MPNIEIDIKFIDASGWQELSWYSSGGTRAKKILQSPDGAEYYFKCSEKKPATETKLAKEYKYEFWNEIIAYQLGKNLGLDVLRYDVAIYNDEIGCLSPKMNKTDDEELIEVGRFMTALNEDFLPENNNARKEYTFQLLEQTINQFNLSKYWELFFQTLLFDAIIGNTDRHQENWSFLGKTSFYSQQLNSITKEIIQDKKLNKLPKWLKKILSLFIDFEKEDVNTIGKHTQLLLTRIKCFAPIYDSGSSLARELTDERVEQLLNDKVALEKYINNGSAELHWNKEKLNHFSLVENLVKSSYIEVVTKSAEFLADWNEDLISLILNNLDKDLPEKWHDFRIPNNRKNLITKIVSLRSKKLKNLLK
jgi:hypothetical protein